LTGSFASFFEGALDSAKERIITPFGETSKDSGKNKILAGMSSVAGNANRKVRDSSEQNISLAFVNAGKEVLLFFNEGLALTREDE